MSSSTYPTLSPQLPLLTVFTISASASFTFRCRIISVFILTKSFKRIIDKQAWRRISIVDSINSFRKKPSKSFVSLFLCLNYWSGVERILLRLLTFVRQLDMIGMLSCYSTFTSCSDSRPLFLYSLRLNFVLLAFTNWVLFFDCRAREPLELISFKSELLKGDISTPSLLASSNTHFSSSQGVPVD